MKLEHIQLNMLEESLDCHRFRIDKQTHHRRGSSNHTADITGDPLTDGSGTTRVKNTPDRVCPQLQSKLRIFGPCNATDLDAHSLSPAIKPLF